MTDGPGTTALGQVPPAALGPARVAAHHAVQWLARAARTALTPAADDRHTSLGWDRDAQALVTHPLTGLPGGPALGLRPGDLTLLALRDGAVEAALPLAGIPETAARSWVFAALTDMAVEAGGIDDPLSYALDEALSGGAYPTDAGGAAYDALAAWYDLADRVLQDFAGGLTDLRPGPSPVRCWPHHFDLATLVALEEGDPETARSVGIGLSPGDRSYGQPYAYAAPWPAPDDLPDLGGPGRWHREGFTAAVLTAEDMLDAGDAAAAMGDFTMRAFAACRRALGARGDGGAGAAAR